jgi:hypothetical protein
MVEKMSINWSLDSPHPTPATGHLVWRHPGGTVGARVPERRSGAPHTVLELQHCGAMVLWAEQAPGVLSPDGNKMTRPVWPVPRVKSNV